MKIKCISFILVLFCYLQVHPQQAPKKPMEVLANENTTISFFFPSNIAKVVSPAVNYKFEHEDGSSIGLLKARKGNPSNLTVITEQGNIYSFSLSFSDKVVHFNFILSSEDAVGNTKTIRTTEVRNEGTPISSKEVPDLTPISKPSNPDLVELKNKPDGDILEMNEYAEEDENSSNVPQTFFDESSSNMPIIEEGDLYNIDREEYYRIFSENNYLQRTIFKRSFRQNKRIVVKLNNILVDRNEMYLVMQLENNSKKDYPVNGLGFFLKKDETEPEQIIEPLYTFNLQDIIDPESINEIVCVFPRINLRSKEEFFVILDEKDGNRTVLLPLDSKQINAPTN